MADTTDSTEEQEVVDSTEEVEELAPDETSEEDQTELTEENEETADEPDTQEESEFKQRYTQFQGESPEEYAKNLETGYDNSSKEAVKLSRENKDLKAQVDRVNALIANNPDLAAAITGTGTQAPVETTPVNPALAFAEAQMKQAFDREYKAFADNHPEIETDPKLADDLDSKLAIVRDVVWGQEKRMVGMEEGLNMAWALLGNKTDSQENLRAAARDQASSGKAASGTRKGETKSKFTEDQISVYMDMSGASRADAIKNLTEFASAQ